jgi:hypothetical protein
MPHWVPEPVLVPLVVPVVAAVVADPPEPVAAVVTLLLLHAVTSPTHASAPAPAQSWMKDNRTVMRPSEVSAALGFRPTPHKQCRRTDLGLRKKKGVPNDQALRVYRRVSTPAR